MATISVGNIKFNWKGPWSSSTTYAVDDVVSLSGSSYISIQAGSNQNPASASAYWQQMSSAGTNGTNGTDLTSTLTAQGDIVYRDGSGLAKLGAGTSGQFLKTQGTGANPVWGTVSTGGLKQIVFAQNASRVTHASSSWADITNITVNITPTSSSNKVLIMAALHYNIPSSNSGFQARIIRDGNSGSTSIFEPNNQKETYINGSGTEHQGRTPYQFLDTPNTTSQITYKIQAYTDGNSTVHFNDSAYSYIYAMEVAV